MTVIDWAALISIIAACQTGICVNHWRNHRSTRRPVVGSKGRGV